MNRLAAFSLLFNLCSSLCFAADRSSAQNRATPGSPKPVAARAAATATPVINGQPKNISARAAIPASAPASTRAALPKNIFARAAAQVKPAASATVKNQRSTPIQQVLPAPVPAKRISARTAYQDPSTSGALGDDYAACRDAYFSCMDQFCATKNDQYRRCLCSARLDEMRERERNFSTATTMLKDFEDNNLNAVDKSASEVKAMYSATVGEGAMIRDASTSAKALSGISDVLTASGKNQDSGERMTGMTDIWGTTELIGGADLSSLEGTALYQAVHAQCGEMVAGSCGKISTAGMVATAYGMYIEQDCAAYSQLLDKQQKQMVAMQKQAAGALHDARIENYDNHNSHEISICLANVRNDMSGAAACGPDNTACTDATGRFLNLATGEPIYSADFYQLENQISLDGDTLHNSVNMPYISMLNSRKNAAEASLDECRDLSDQVWDEYLRQTLIDLAQKQRQKVKDVQEECLGIVNNCYDEKMQQLKEFALDLSDEIINADATTLTEQLCQVKLETCAILYGGGPPGLEKLREYTRNVNTRKLRIACDGYLESFIETLCTPIGDSTHESPYKCRIIKPGKKNDHADQAEQQSLYAQVYKKAADVCIRPDEILDGNGNLPTDVEMIISVKINETWTKLDAMLSAECATLGGAWQSNTFSSVPEMTAPSLDSWSHINVNEAWGRCPPPIM